MDHEGLDPEVRDAAREEQEALDRMGNFSIEQVIQAGHEAILRRLVAKAQAGTISHQEMSVLRNMLRDNGMVLATPPGVELPKADRPADLPQFNRPEWN